MADLVELLALAEPIIFAQYYRWRRMFAWKLEHDFEHSVETFFQEGASVNPSMIFLFLTNFLRFLINAKL